MTWQTLANGDLDKGITTQTAGGLPATLRLLRDGLREQPGGDLDAVRLRLEYERLRLLRGFEELLCLQGLEQVEHLPHQIEAVRRVLRQFHGRVLLADEVGLGKTIEACLLLREYVLRGMVQRVLILVPPALVTQWRDELAGKFMLEFATPPGNAKPTFWAQQSRVLASLALAKGPRHLAAVSACAWDLVIVDEAHHCKNRATKNWQLINALQRRYLFLLTATPVENNLVELYNLLTLLEPGHLKTEADFRRNYVKRGNPRDPRNRERLRGLLGEVMIRNTRSLVSVKLPPRYAQTFVVHPDDAEARLYSTLDTYLRWRCPRPAAGEPASAPAEAAPVPAPEAQIEGAPGLESGAGDVLAYLDAEGIHPLRPPGDLPAVAADPQDQPPARAQLPSLNWMQINALLMAGGSHPLALLPAIERLATEDSRAQVLRELARGIQHSAKERKLLELLREGSSASAGSNKTLVFANFRATIERLDAALTAAGIEHVVFSGAQSIQEKQAAVQAFRERVPVMVCSDSGGEGHNLQFANTLINFDLPWNPMRIEQRTGRVHRIGQTHEVFVFNLCTAGSLEERILRVLNDKIRMFELVVGEVGSILGNLEHGEEFESLVLGLWLKSRSPRELDAAFEQLGESLVAAQEQYLQARELDEALFGEDYE